ncbi:MAG: hypothetical protein JWO19_1590 [Bryobacterales bacterium]|jgi:hypothetical protein|nr:hypothetical protein [Bryobacterales bacterium]
MINHFHKLRTLVLMFALVSAVASAQEGGKNDPDRAVTGGQFPAGWNVRPDRGTPAGIKFSQAGDVYHFQMGSAGTFYRNDWIKSGNYTYSARLTQLQRPSHPISYGLVIGGTNMGPTPTYTYFLVRNQGEYFIANWEGSGPKTVVDWTANPAIVKQGADGKQTNTLGIQVQGDNVIFTVNGMEVARQPKSKIHADGQIGFRIGHNLDVDVDQVKR